MLVHHLWLYLTERFHFHVKSSYFTFKNIGVVFQLSIFLFTKTNVSCELC